eukprot:gene12079-5572_t
MSTKKEEIQNLIVSKGILNQIVLVDDYLNSNLKKDFCWKDIPMFSVISGENGVGKSKLLNAILYGYHEKKIKISNVSLDFNEIKQDIEILALKFDGENFIPLFQLSENTSDNNFQTQSEKELKPLIEYCQKRCSEESVTINDKYEMYWNNAKILISKDSTIVDAVKTVFLSKKMSFFKSINNLFFSYFDEVIKKNETVENS